MTTFVDSATGAPYSEFDRLVEHATKLLRVASAINAVDDELERQTITAGTAGRLARLQLRLLIELASALSDEGQAELAALVKPPDELHASELDVRVGFAQLAGWVGGLVDTRLEERRLVAAGVAAAA